MQVGTVSTGNLPNFTATERKELKEQLEKQEQILDFSKSWLAFAQHISEGSKLIKNLLRSKTASESIEAIKFFTSAKNFSLKDHQAAVSEMLLLLYQPENDRKDSVSQAFRTMFLSSTAKTDRYVLCLKFSDILNYSF